VVSDRAGVVQMDHKSVGPEGETNRSALPLPPANMTRALNEIETNRLLGEAPWEAKIETAAAKNDCFKRPHSSTDVLLDTKGNPIAHPAESDRIPDRPKLIRGVIGASDTLIKDGEVRDRMAAEFDLRAMEMEGAGVLEASWNFGQSAMIVRGVCDYGVGKNDIWQPYAALAAAAVSLSLIART
jgi:nucleoside phosphorylase